MNEMRKLMETIEKIDEERGGGRADAYYDDLLASIPQERQRQDATRDQLLDLIGVANKLGMYDAADYIQLILKNQFTSVK